MNAKTSRRFGLGGVKSSIDYGVAEIGGGTDVLVTSRKFIFWVLVTGPSACVPFYYKYKILLVQYKTRATNTLYLVIPKAGNSCFGVSFYLLSCPIAIDSYYR